MVVGGGFEPPKAMLADLQSAPFSHSGIPPVSLFNILPELRFYNRQTIFFSIIFTDISQKTTDGGVSRPISRLAALASSGSIAFRRDKRRGYKYALSRRSLGEDGSPLFLLAKHDIAARSIRRLNHSFFKHGVKWWCGLTARMFCPCGTAARPHKRKFKSFFGKCNYLRITDFMTSYLKNRYR